MQVRAALAMSTRQAVRMVTADRNAGPVTAASSFVTSYFRWFGRRLLGVSFTLRPFRDSAKSHNRQAVTGPWSAVRVAVADSHGVATATGGGIIMGRKSRHKLERRLGQVQPTAKEAERAMAKAKRHAQRIPPTVEAYERVAASGPARLTEALVGRHATRIENLDAVAQLSMNQCLRHLLSVCELDAVFVRRGHCLTQHGTPHESPWPTHLSWSLLSTIAALRLILAGQTVGAAIVLRQQLGRWTLLLALAAGIGRRGHESIESFIARVWTHSTMDNLGTFARTSRPLIDSMISTSTHARPV